jgi:hypothetical protein
MTDTTPPTTPLKAAEASVETYIISLRGYLWVFLAGLVAGFLAGKFA